MNEEINPQDKVFQKPAFKSQEKKDRAKIPESQSAKEKKDIGDKKKNIKSTNSLILWFFFGVAFFLFIGLLTASVYMLQTQGGIEIFQAMGVSTTSAQTGLKNIVNGIYILSILVLIVMLVIGAGIMASSNNKKSTVRKNGLYSMIFSVFFIFVLGLSYVLLFPLLYNQSQTNETDLARYIQVTPNPPNGSAPLRVFLDATALDNINDNLFFEWDFGDDSVKGTGAEISHEYEEPGIYYVKLLITSPKEKYEVDTNITVLVDNKAATPRIVTDVKEGEAPLEVHFDASTSEDPSGEIISYVWDFDDKDSGANQSKGIEAIHIYEKAGTYEVRLTITDENNEQRSIAQTILVKSSDSGIRPKIVASPKKGNSPLEVTFNASGSTHNNEDRTLMSFEWDFGDGKPKSLAREIKHTFINTGIFNVILTITDDEGNKKQEIIEIIVSDELEAPEAKIVSSPTILIGEAPFEVELDGKTSLDFDGEIVSYSWSFGDGSPTEIGPEVTHTYMQAGQYTIALTVEDNDGKKGSTSMIANIEEVGQKAPIVEVTTNPNPPQGVVPFSIEFDASGSEDPDGSIISYLWDFGDNSEPIPTTAPRATHKYQKVGLWPVKVTATDNDGLETVFNLRVAVNTEAPVAKIKANRTTAYAPATIHFDASACTGNISAYSWDFGDNEFDTGLLTEHEYSTPGNFIVTLTIEDAQGQTDSIIQNIIIK